MSRSPDTAAPTQTWNAEQYARNARFVADLGAPVVALLAPQADERILDLGCGDGALSDSLIAAGAVVVGVDASAEMAAAARARGLDVRVMDAHALAFENEFDAVFSNAALHWMLEPDRVIAGVRRALRPGGRFVGEMGGHGNVARIVDALVAALERRGIDGRAAIPWYFPTAEEYRARLEGHGFTVTYAALIPRQTALPADIEAWLDTFAEIFFGGLSQAERHSMRVEVVERLRPHLTDAEGRWSADYVRLRFAARL